MSMDKVNKKDFHTNAAISSKSKEYPGIMPVVACADVTRFGNATMHNSNTCKATDIVGGGDRSRSLREEYIDWLKYMREQRDVIETTNKKVAKELGCFLDNLESFINNFPGGLLNFIYPSIGARKSGNILSDLEKNLIGKMKVWALPSSGPNDCDHVGLINDNEGINIAKVYGAKQLGYYNGSDLVSWMPTGAQFDKLSRNLNSLLGYSSIDLTYGENFFAYIVQTFMNVIFINNQFLPEADRLKIIDNYKSLLKCIEIRDNSWLGNYQKSMNECSRPVEFIQILLKKICKGTSLEKLDLNNKQNEAKYIDLICGVSIFLTGAQHPNQVLLEQWIFDENKESECVIGDAFLGKNNVLYVPFHTILQRYIRLNSDKSKKEDDTQIKNKNMLNYMLNLAGKFRYKKTKFDLSNTETKSEYHFGCKVTDNHTNCQIPTEYNTEISVEELTELLNKITEFYDFETKIKDSKYKLADKDIEKILQYLLDGRQFHDDAFKKIAKDKNFMGKLLDTAKKKSIKDQKCCYQNVYEILANEYFDLMIENKLIDKNFLSKEKLMRYFENVNHKYEIIELKPELVAELGLISKLKADDINKFLSNKSEVKKQKKMIEILKLVIGKISSNILNGLDLKYFDSELLETVILSRYNDLYNATIGNIDFKQLNLETQIVLLKKMADNDFKAFSFENHWENINSEAWKSLSIEGWRKFVYNKILILNECVPKKFFGFKRNVKFDLTKRKDILQLMPINILALFDAEEGKNENKLSAFSKFFYDNFDSWTAKQILAFGICPTKKMKTLKSKLKPKKDKLRPKEENLLSENAVETFLSLQQIFQNFVKNKALDYNNSSVEKMLFDFFEKQLSDEKNLDNITECLKYIFNGDENNYFTAMIIMEEFILLDDNTVKPNDKDQYIFSDSFHLESDKKQKLLQISEKIKSALNWDDEQSRKKILQQLFSHISKINELMILFDKSVHENWRFKQFIDIYKSFLDRILSLYTNDIIESKIADKVPFIFLNNEESIKLFCQKLGDKININNFSEMINAINKVEVNYDEYKISNALGVGKVLFIIDKIKQIKEDSIIMDEENNPDEGKYAGLSGFMQDIRRNASLICNGYAIDESDNSIENHLGQYDENGEISYGKLDSILFAMFKNICEDQTTVNEFIKKYGDLNKQELEKIKETKNQVGNFKAFEELMLPLIEKDYKDKDVDFVKFVKKYDLLKVISVENLDENIINMAFDCMHRSSLSWDNFIKKYYVLDKPDKNEIIIEKDYHIKGLKDPEIQKIMTQILLEDKDIKDIKEILSKANTNIIGKLYESLLLKDKNKNIKPEIEKMRDEIEKYFENVVAIKHAWNSNQRLNTEKLAKIWFAKDDGDIKSKTNKLSTMIEIYQSKRTDETWKKFSEIYILRHLNQDTIKKYKELAPTYKKIQDLEAKASNLKEQVALFYQKLGGGTFNQNIKSICSRFEFESEYKAKAIKTQFLIRVNKSNNIYDDFKEFFDLLEKINEMYDDDEVKKICEKYKNEDQNGVEKLFSSIANRVHFFEDYQTIIKKIPALDSQCEGETNEYQFRDTAQKILGKQLASKLDIEKNFAFLLVRSLEKLNKILDNLPNENQNQHNEEIESLKQIYEKYNKLCSDDLRSLEDMKVIFKNNDGKFEFETDFQQIQDILKKMDIKDCDVFNKCLSIFETDVLPDYEREMKRRDNFSNFVKFIETGIANGYFSDAQICNMYIINIFDENDLQSYTLEAEIKKLHVMVGSAGRVRLKKIAEDLCPKNRLEYVICDSDQPDQYISAMRKLFLHMDYSKAKTFIKDYDFKSFPNIENQGQNQINTYQRRFNAFGRTLQNTLLDLFKSSEYKKIDFKAKFILGGCFFESMLRGACQNDKLTAEEEFDDLFKMIRERILSVLTNPPQSFNARLGEVEDLLKKESFNTSLNELIACAFLSAHIYICSGHIDGVEMPRNIVNLEDEFYDKIISMLARSTGKEEKFKDIENVKKWVYGSSLKYFIQGTFNLKDIPENERTDDQMELEQTELIKIYNERILEHILSRIDEPVSVFDVLENIYCDDENKVVCKFDIYYLLEFLKTKVIPASEIGEKEEKKKHCRTLLKFLKRIEFSNKYNRKRQEGFVKSFLACAKKLGLLDEKNKFVDEEALRIWIRNVLPIFSKWDYVSGRVIGCMAYNLGDNISVLDLIDILKEESKQEPRLIDWLKDCNNFVSNLRGPYKPYKNGKKQKRKDVSHKCEDVVNFLNKICRTGYFDFNLLTLFPLFDTIEEVSVDDTDGTKKFNTFEDLKSFCNDDFFNGKSDRDVKNLLCFLYAISRIPKDKTLLDVITEYKYQIKKIFPNGYKCNREVFESALQAVYDCLSKEKITNENRNKYVDFVFDFFATIKTDDFLNKGNNSRSPEYQIKQLEKGEDVFPTIGKIFNLVYDKSTKKSIYTLLKYINDTFADKRDAMKGYDYRLPILCSMLCESIKNMTIEDIISDEVKFIWEILDKLYGKYREELNWCDADRLKTELNAKIKEHLKKQKDDKTREDEAKKILYAFCNADRCMPQWLDFEWCYDTFNSSDLTTDNTDSQKLVFKDAQCLNKFWSNSQKQIEVKSANMLYPGTTIDKLIYALSRLPQNTSVIDVLKMMKENKVGSICLESGIEYESQIKFLKDVILKIEDEINSNKKKYTENKNMFDETLDCLFDFFKGIISNEALKSDFLQNQKDKRDSSAKNIIFSSLRIFKTLLSEHHFTDLSCIETNYNTFRWVIYGDELSENQQIKNELNDISRSMKLKMLDKYHIFEFLNNMRDTKENYEDWIKNDKDLCEQLLERMEKPFDQYQNMPSKSILLPNSHKKTNIEFFIRYADKKDFERFERVVRLAVKICYGYVDKDNNFVRFAVCRYNLKDWIISFGNMFYNVGAVDVDIVRRIALEHIISNFSNEINVFDLLFSLRYQLFKDEEHKKLTTLDKETSKKLVNKILMDKFCEGWAYKAYDEYEGLGRHGKINFVSQLLQGIGVEIEAEEKERLYDGLRKQEQEQKKLMEEDKRIKSHEWGVNNNNQNRNENKSNSTDIIQENPEQIISTSTNINKEDTIIKNNKSKKDNIDTIYNRDKNKNEVDDTINQNETKKIVTINNNVNNNQYIIKQQIPLTRINHANRIHSFSDNHKGNKKSKPILEYLFWFLTFCAVVFCIYFFATSAIVKAIIALIAAIIIGVISILIRRCSNTKEKPKSTIRMPLLTGDSETQQRPDNLSPEMLKCKSMSKNDISEPNQ